MALLPFAANTTDNSEKQEDRSALPQGDYLVHIVSSEYKANKAETGHFLAVRIVVLEGKHKGGNIFLNLNLDNPNAMAMDIARKELNSICDVCDKVGVQDSELLHQIPFIATVGIQKGNAQYPDSNKITKYKKATDGGVIGYTPTPAENVPSSGDVPGSVSAPADPPAEATRAKFPWEV